MPAQIFDGPYPQDITDTTAGLVYLISGADNEKDARDKLVDEAPMIYDDKVQDGYNITSLKIPGGGWFKATVRYKAKATGLPAGGGGEITRGIEFSFGGISRLVQVHTGSSSTALAAGWTQRIPTGIVNAELTANGGYRVVGAQMPIGIMRFSIKKRFARGRLTDDIVNLIESLYDCVNEGKFLGFDPNTVIFDGCDGAQSGSESDVTFNFRKGKYIDTTTDGIAWQASPFDHVWVLSVPEKVGSVFVNKAKEVHINYKDRADLALLPL